MPTVFTSKMPSFAACLLKTAVVSLPFLTIAPFVTLFFHQNDTVQVPRNPTVKPVLARSNYEKAAEFEESNLTSANTILATTTPDDRYTTQQWSLHSSDIIPGATGLFASRQFLANGKEVVVAVVDSGVMLEHEDLSFLPGYDFIHSTSVANDGDPRDHDPSDPGDWINQEDISLENVSQDCPLGKSKWHGTAIAGIIGATSHNAAGIAGGASAVSMLPVRVTGKCGGYVADLIDGIRWSAGLPVRGVADNPHPANVINLSVAFPGGCSRALQRAIDDASNTGAVIVTAATNSGVNLDDEPYAPATCTNLITVAATDRQGSITGYSALGKSVFISAPGGTVSDGIITTQNDGGELPLPYSAYGYHYGTSIATAHVSAAVANLLSYQPDLSIAQIRQLLAASAASIDDDRRCTSGHCGYGRLRAYDAIKLLSTGYLLQNDVSEDIGNAPVQLAATESDTTTVITATANDGLRGIGSADKKLLLLLSIFLFIRKIKRRR